MRARKSLGARESLERVCGTLGHLWQGGSSSRAATNTVTSIAAHCCCCHSVPPPMPGPDNLLERNSSYLPKLEREEGGGSTCAERHWISLHRAAFSFG